jgi:ABC-type transporter Mla MlaB component
MPADRDTIELQLEGPITVAEVAEWRSALLAVLERGKPVRLGLGGAGPWDAAGLQLVLSAMDSGRRSGVPVRLDGADEPFLSVVGRAGAEGVIAEMAGASRGRA